MGQGLGCCECVYSSYCFSCQGCAWGFLCCGCWLCPPQPVQFLRGPGCCQCGCNQGCGTSQFCCSYYMCIPNWMQDYSNWLSIKDRRANGRDKIYDLKIVPVAVAVENYAPGSNRHLR